VGTNTLIATPLARPPWSAAADARVIVWNDHPTGSDPAVIAQVSDVGSLAAALGCGVAAVWVGHDVGPTAAIDALGPPGALGAQYPSTTQLILEVGVHDNGNDSDNGPGVSVEEELAGLARLAAAQGLAPGRLVPAVRAQPRVDLPAALASWRADPHLRRHPLIVVIPTATPPATGAGLVAAAVMAGAAVATDDVRAASRVLEVLLAIEQHRHTDRPGDRARPDDEGELR